MNAPGSAESGNGRGSRATGAVARVASEVLGLLVDDWRIPGLVAGSAIVALGLSAAKVASPLPGLAYVMGVLGTLCLVVLWRR